MIEADSFLKPALESGFGFYSGVPCSFLTPIINRVISDDGLAYVAAASEGEAVAIASGAWLAGKDTVVMCQNSGLGNAVNPLTSLNHPFRIPTLLIVTWRGGPGIEDEPQHQLMGPITPGMLDVIQIPHRLFPSSDNEIAGALAEARETMAKTDLPFAMIMEKGAVRDDGIAVPPPTDPVWGTRTDLQEGGALPGRVAAMERLLALAPDNAALVATTGFSGRELYTAPKNLIHIVFDNGAYESTGGQPTVSPTVDFARVAIGCGYPQALTCDGLAGFDQALARALGEPGPHLIHMKVSRGTISGLGRPKITPAEVARRFRSFVTGS
jgi:phosphonopyruvate decarboxylase